MRIRENRQGEVLVLAMSGRMTIGDGDGEAGELIRQKIGEGERRILLDMGEVSALDSSGVGELVLSYKLAQQCQSALKLLHLTPRVGDTLKCSMLTGIFEIFDYEDDALASFD